MKPNSAIAAPLRNITSAIVILSALLFTICTPRLRAQVGDNNPTGVSGIFNGQAGGCGYDPYTGNATRTITDISVAGGVGDYPLALVRTANSRTPSTTGVFSYVGGWNHNYNWIMEDSPAMSTQNSQPVKYTVDFPDGRVETFRAVTWDTFQPCTTGAPCYRVRPGPDTPAQTTSAGVRERIVPLNVSTMLVYLILPDGGKVKFSATQIPSNGKYFYKYQAAAIIDPHGLETTLTWENYGNGKKRLTKVTDPAGTNGRYLQFSYPPNNSPHISQVQEFINGSAGRIVQYNYYLGYVQLDSVVYYGNPNWTAHYQYVAANVGGEDMPQLLYTCDDPMYPGPMHKIAYTYRTTDNYTGNHAVYGQISSENHYDGTSVGPAVSTLTIPSATTRTETRGDNKTRTFTYTTDGYLTSCTDFMTPSHTASQGYDGYKYINYVTDRNGHRTDFTNDNITGNVLQVQFPLTPEDTSGQGNTRPTINYTYTNNYYLHTIQGENGQTATILRDSSNRLSEIDYPDPGYYETFPLYNAFNQVLTHRMVTGGTETFTYDTRGLRQEYRNPDNVNGNPTARYRYDNYDRISDVTDVLGGSAGDINHTTSFEYNLRGQITKTWLPTDPQPNGARHSIVNTYNDPGNNNGSNNNNAGDGTLVSVTDELNNTTSYTYDDYRRLKTVTPPARNGSHTTSFYYDANGSGDDYRYTDANVTYLVLPSGKKTKIFYDDNRRKSYATVAYGTSDAATTSYGFDNVGNVSSVTNPLNHNNVSTLYDERNRPYSISVGGQTTTLAYDTAGRKSSITRPNGQVITYESYDNMNRLLQQRMTQTPEADGVSRYVYYAVGNQEGQPVGLLKTFEDPRIYNSGNTYKYEWDTMGRKKKLTYPPDSDNVQRTEQWSYDTSGRLWTFTNRNGNIQTFGYDALNRMTGFTWNDGGTTPSVSFGYDFASRLISASNVNANVTRAYYDDNLLQYETEQIILSGGSSKTVTYTYDTDGNRASTQYPVGLFPDASLFNYTYTNRNQLESVAGWASYVYNTRGNLITRTLSANNTTSGYVPDTHDRVTQINHTFAGNNSRTVNYGYWDENNSNNRKWTKRSIIIPPQSPEDNRGEVFVYDLAGQATGVVLDVSSPNTTPAPTPNIHYDGNGNRMWFNAYEWLDTYTTNNLNQYTLRNSLEGDNPQATPRPTPTPRPSITPAPRPGDHYATYDHAGNMTIGFDASNYTYDAQNRLAQATTNGVTFNFKYDGFNRQVWRSVTDQPDTFSVWDGWDLIQEYQAANNGAATAAYLYGATGLIADSHVANSGFNYYYQDARGSTSHLADGTGHLLEWYRYDLDGTPFLYDANDSQLPASNYSVRHLFTGQQWYQDLGLYDLRFRFYSPDLGRFLQPDPFDFNGDPTNLYRYCRNNPVRYADPSGRIPVVGTVFGAVTGGVAGAISGYYQGGWAGSGLGLVTGGIVGGAVGTFFEPGAPSVGSLAASAIVGAAASYLGQVAGNASGHIVQGQLPQTSDLTNVNPGMIAGAGVGGAISPFIQAGGAAVLGTGYAGRTMTSIVDGFVGGSSELIGGQIYTGEPDPATTSATSGNVEIYDVNGNLIGTMPRVVVTATPINTRAAQTIGGVSYPYGFGNISPGMNFGGGIAGTITGGSAWDPAGWQGGLSPAAEGMWFASNLAGQGLVHPLFP